MAQFYSRKLLRFADLMTMITGEDQTLQENNAPSQ